jgi:hypothetical protein
LWDTLKATCPRTSTYLRKYRDLLLRRKAFGRYFRKGDPFYSMFGIGEYTFAPRKVVWAEQGRLGCAVIEQEGDKPVVPDHKVMLIPCDDADEAHFVCALANSAPFRLAVRSYAISIQQDPHVFANVRVPECDPSNADHCSLSKLSRRAHGIAGGDLSALLSDVEREADDLSLCCLGLVLGRTWTRACCAGRDGLKTLVVPADRFTGHAGLILPWCTSIGTERVGPLKVGLPRPRPPPSSEHPFSVSSRMARALPPVPTL